MPTYLERRLVSRPSLSLLAPCCPCLPRPAPGLPRQVRPRLRQGRRQRLLRRGPVECGRRLHDDAFPVSQLVAERCFNVAQRTRVIIHDIVLLYAAHFATNNAVQFEMFDVSSNGRLFHRIPTNWYAVTRGLHQRWIYRCQFDTHYYAIPL